MKCQVMIEEVVVEARDVIVQRGNRELEKAQEFARIADRKAMALGCARTAAMIFLQLGEEFADRLQEARGLVEKLEADVAQQRNEAFEAELKAVRAAALTFGLGSEAEIAEEKLGRLQEGLWIEMQKRVAFPRWDKVGEKSRRNMDAGLVQAVDALVQKAKAVPGVRDVSVGEVWKVFESRTANWVVKITVDAVWGRRSFMVQF